MYPVLLGSSFQVQQVVSGTGVFDQTEQGRAGVTIGSGSAQIKLKAKLLGTAPNALTVVFLDTGAGTTTILSVAQVGTVITVKLGRTVGGLTSTAVAVAQALNDFMAPPGFQQPLRATYGGDGSGIVQPTGSPAALTGGIDPAIDPSGTQFNYIWAPNTNGGFFYFENDDFLIIRDLQANFPTIGGGTSHLQFLRVNLDQGLNPIAGSGIPVFESDVSPAFPAIGVTDVRIPLLPFQALTVVFTVGSSAGTIRMIARREARFPYL
jgi:hypothetical protein